MLREKIITIMDSAQSYPWASLATVLHGGAALYGGVMHLRRYLYAKGFLPTLRLNCPVISIGNLAVGGAGKTPMTIHLAQHLKQMGLNVAIISRGYKRLEEKQSRVVCDGRSLLCDMPHAGDEPYLMALLLKNVPVVVGRDRFAAGKLAIRLFDPDVIVLDDAFQHQRLSRDLNIVLMDARAPLGNGYLLPRGRLREPISSLARADAAIFTRLSQTAAPRARELSRVHPSIPTFHTDHQPVFRGFLPAMEIPGAATLTLDDGKPRPSLDGMKFFAFSALAGNAGFQQSVRDLGGQILGAAEYEDHYRYRRQDILAILGNALSAGCDALVTSDKDYVRLPADAALALPLYVLGVTIRFKDGDHRRWEQFLQQKLEALKMPEINKAP